MQVPPKYAARVTRRLDEVYAQAERIPLEDSERAWVIFSDVHKGARNGADDFQKAERAYNAALAYYCRAGFNLVELGDIEELWKERPQAVLRKYRRTLELTAEFHKKGQYWRVWGNHDDYWNRGSEVERLLGGLFPELKVHEGLVLPLRSLGVDLEFFLVHGHQGTAGSDKYGEWARIPVRYLWRPIQRLTQYRLNTPAESWELREGHNIALYRWAEARWRSDAAGPHTILVAGHTHRPVFVSESLVQWLEDELRRLESRGEDSAVIADVAARLEWARPLGEGATETSDKPRLREPLLPCYFNTGCCCYLDGDITGIEIEGGELRLVRWPDDDGAPRRKVLEAKKLASIVSGVRRDGEDDDSPAGGADFSVTNADLE